MENTEKKRKTRKKPALENYILKYYQSIKNGSVVVGEWVRLVYEKIVSGIENKTYLFDQKKANDAIDWFEEHTFHCEGPLAPGKISLELWQKAFLSCIFGIIDPKTNTRQFREVVLIVARKNGKSLLAAGIGKYEWTMDGGYGSRVYCLAPKLDQADIIYNDIWQMCLLDPEWQSKKIASEEKDESGKKKDDPTLERHRMTDLYLPSTNSTVKKIAFSAKKSDGFNPSLTICDEVASWQGDQGLKQYEVMKSGMGARPEGLILSCSTAGYINESIYDELIKRGTRVLLGDSNEKRLLPMFYMIDDITKWSDINELRKSNPNLGVSVSVDYLLEEIAVAEGSLSKKAEFITKYCNIKQNSSQAWLSSQDVELVSGAQLSLEDFRNCYCVGGIDLSRTTDLTACTIIIEKSEKLYVFAKFFMPGERIQEATERDNLPYNAYIQRGLLVPSGDNFVDYHDCFKWFCELVEKYQIYPLKVGYDRYTAQYLVQEMEQYGFNMDDVFQGYNLTPVIIETEGLIKDCAFDIGDNDLLKIHLLDMAVKVEAESERCKPIKMSSTAHIDGAAALLDAMTVRQKYYSEIGEQLRNE